MNIVELQIESLGDHDYLLRIGMDDDVVTVRVYADPDVVSGLGGDEQRVVAATVAFLTARQRADDLPADLDLADVAAAYDDYLDRLRAELH